MCIFSGPVESVSKTKILVAPVSKDAQLTVYANQVQLDESKPTAMILPFPNPTGRTDGVAMVDMTEFKDGFFKLVEKAFPSEYMMQKSLSNGMFASRGIGPSTLEVFDCGSYQYSVVPTLGDLERIRADVFSLDPNVQRVLAKHYAQGFGFLVCILKRSGSYSPIAYTSPMINGKMFIPTRHEHGPSHGMNYRRNDFYQANARLNHRIDNPEYADDWDHEIYILGGINRATSVPQMAKTTMATDDIIQLLPGNHVITKMIGHIDKDYFYKWRIQGTHQNGDLSVVSLFAINIETCTFPASGNGYLIQPWFNCVTCRLVNGLGCCVACATTCHKGHVLIPRSLSPFFCDCREKASCSFAGKLPPSSAPINLQPSTSLIGQRVADVQRQAFVTNQPHLWRFVPEGSAVTMELVYGRTTVFYNDQYIVTSVDHE